MENTQNLPDYMADAPLIPAVTELMLLSSFIQIQEK